MVDAEGPENGAEGAEMVAEKPKAKSKSKPKSKPASKSQAKSAERQIRITQVRSGAGRPRPHRATLRALGLRRHQQSVVQKDNPAVRGMIFKVRHLVEVEELGGKE